MGTQIMGHERDEGLPQSNQTRSETSWQLWSHGAVSRKLIDLQPRLASWDRSDHPSQKKLRAYVTDIVERLSPLPDGPLFLDLQVDSGSVERLLQHCDLENYLTPLFGRRYLPPSRFVFVTARKQVGGGSSLRIGRAEPVIEEPGSPTYQHFTAAAGSGCGTRCWKERIHSELALRTPQPLPPGPVEVQLAWRCSSKRNWTTLWKATGDCMGPVLGYAWPDRIFHPLDDRIVSLGLHLNVDDSLGWNTDVGMWWRSLCSDAVHSAEWDPLGRR